MPASLKHLTDKRSCLTSLLARWKDGLYYTAAVIRCDQANKRCLVCFEDGSEIWLTNRDVHLQLSLDQLNEEEDIVCCMCDDGGSEPPNEIILCDVCQQGYHQKCHVPPVDSSKIDESEETSDHKDWFCATCSYILNQSDAGKSSDSATTTTTPTPTPSQTPTTTKTTTQPQPKNKQQQEPEKPQQRPVQQPQAQPHRPSPAKPEPQKHEAEQQPHKASPVKKPQDPQSHPPAKPSSNQAAQQQPPKPPHQSSPKQSQTSTATRKTTPFVGPPHAPAVPAPVAAPDPVTTTTADSPQQRSSVTSASHEACITSTSAPTAVAKTQPRPRSVKPTQQAACVIRPQERFAEVKLDPIYPSPISLSCVSVQVGNSTTRLPVEYSAAQAFINGEQEARYPTVGVKGSDLTELSVKLQKTSAQPLKRPHTSPTSTQHLEPKVKVAKPKQSPEYSKPSQSDRPVSASTPPQAKLAVRGPISPTVVPSAVSPARPSSISSSSPQPSYLAPSLSPSSSTTTPPSTSSLSSLSLTTSPSTAALASMTASSALLVGSSAGRTKQDMVNQSNRSNQQRQHRNSPARGESSEMATSTVISQPPVKNAVRKSSVNFLMPPVRQSALPTATRSVLPTIVTPAVNTTNKADDVSS